jgi:phosphatidylinositol alpha-mannosyltransferase
MRVGLLCPYSLTMPGGVQNQVMGLARALRRRGHEARVVAPCDGTPPAPFVTSIGSSVQNPSNGSIAPIAPAPSVQLRTIRVLWDERFDVLHLHEPFVPGPTLTASLLKPTPMVATFHAAGNEFAYRRVPGITRWGAARLDVRVAVSPEALATIEPYCDSPFTVLFNGIEGERFSSAVPWPTSGPTVFFLGRHEPRKGLDVLLRAVADLPPDTTVWVAGEGDDTDELKRRFPDPRIEWLGRIDDDERDRRMAGADVFCAPSRGGESFGVILLEAMAAGTPVVASDIPGYAKVATGSASGLGGAGSPEGACLAAELVAPDDPGALARAVTRILSDDRHAELLRTRGRARAAEFDLERLCDHYLEIYEAAVACHAGRAGTRRS